MVATLKTDVIEKFDGSPVDLTGQSAAKAWSNLNTSSGFSVAGSFNVSSGVDKGTGKAQINFTSLMLNNAYSNQVTSIHGVSIGHEANESAFTRTAAAVSVWNKDYNGNYGGAYSVSSVVHGDLA
ncbi:MAG: hypothetical protein HWE34_12715 [Methylocystaceae bacterium]|nr:hypothetical protein [Methylocystaceae bacterium]